MPKEQTTERSIRKSQIGRCGELLGQYQLLRRGIESAPMTTDTGVDLVAYAPEVARPFSIQVKTNLKAKPGGGKGKAALDWWIDDDTPAQLVAFVDLASQKIWIVLREELATLAQQRSSGRFHLYMYTDPTHKPKKQGRLAHIYEFERYLLENRAHDVFGIQATGRHFRHEDPNGAGRTPYSRKRQRRVLAHGGFDPVDTASSLSRRHPHRV